MRTVSIVVFVVAQPFSHLIQNMIQALAGLAFTAQLCLRILVKKRIAACLPPEQKYIVHNVRRI